MKHMVKQLDYLDGFKKATWLIITPAKYLEWKKQYTFDGLKNISPGRSFCNYFDIIDNVLLYIKEWPVCEEHIKLNYVRNDYCHQ